MTKILLAFITLTMLTSGVIAGTKVSVDSVLYVAPGAIAYKVAENDLVLKMIELCGSREEIKSVQNVIVTVMPSDSSSGAFISPNNTLTLNYPRIKAQGSVECVK